jgi:membrane protease YdiL (CAAX protease family)
VEGGGQWQRSYNRWGRVPYRFRIAEAWVMGMDIDWRMRRGIASSANFAVLLAVLLSFPLVLRWTGAFAFADIDSLGQQHTRAFLKFCFILTAFLWVCFTIALTGIRRKGSIRWQELVGARWNRWQSVFGDIGIAFATLVAMGVIGNLSNVVFGPIHQESAAFRALVAQNIVEAVAFLVPAFSAGFVEEFVFRGYLQRQFQALSGNLVVGSILQVMVFSLGHYYQGWIRLVPVVLIGTLLTIVALWRKCLVPGMIAHGLGDGLVSFSFFLKHL